MKTRLVKKLSELNNSELVEIATRLNLNLESPIEFVENDFSDNENLEGIIMSMVEILYSSYGVLVITTATDKTVLLSAIYEKLLDEEEFM